MMLVAHPGTARYWIQHAEWARGWLDGVHSLRLGMRWPTVMRWGLGDEVPLSVCSVCLARTAHLGQQDSIQEEHEYCLLGTSSAGRSACHHAHADGAQQVQGWPISLIAMAFARHYQICLKSRRMAGMPFVARQMCSSDL